MQKNTIKVFAVIGTMLGIFGLTFGYFAVSKPETVDPILLLSQIPAMQQGAYPSGTVKQYSFVVSVSGGSMGYSSPVYITKPSTIISVWIKLNATYTSGDYDVYLYLDTPEVGGAWQVQPPLLSSVADSAWHQYQEPEIDLPYGSGYEYYFRIGINNQLGGLRNFIVIVQVVEYSLSYFFF